jgi:hypothetical protein
MWFSLFVFEGSVLEVRNMAYLRVILFGGFTSTVCGEKNVCAINDVMGVPPPVQQRRSTAVTRLIGKHAHVLRLLVDSKHREKAPVQRRRDPAVQQSAASSWMIGKDAHFLRFVHYQFIYSNEPTEATVERSQRHPTFVLGSFVWECQQAWVQESNP